MKLSTSALIEAVRLHLGPDLATAFAAQASRQEPSGELPPTLDDGTIGSSLAASLGLRSDPTGVELHSVRLFPPSGAVTLGTADALDHPLLVAIPETLAGAIAAPIVAGARAHFLARSTPIWAAVHLAEAGGALHGSVDLRLETAEGIISAVAIYGDARGDRTIVTTHSISAAALYEIGRVTRAAAIPAPTIAPPGGGQLLNIVPGSGALN